LVILLAVRLMLKILRRRVTAGPKDDIWNYNIAYDIETL
jgi:hypothetical protein